MSVIGGTITDPRAGAAVCVCPPGLAGQVGITPQSTRTVALLAVGAAASVLSQALMFSLLPLVGTLLAPSPSLAALPMVALFVGAVAATFPASILTDAFGRRAAFALGASLGVAGGLVVAWGLVYGAFWPLVVGAFWIGIANGFALRYRHVAAAGADPTHTVAVVLGTGAVVGLIAPTLSGFAETGLTPFIGAGTALVAAAAHVFALGAAIALPQAEPAPAPPALAEVGAHGWLMPTFAAMAAWFGMMAVMTFAPIGLTACGIGFSTTVGAIAWHLVAMYAPALALGLLVNRLGTACVIAVGLALVGAAAVVDGTSPTGPAIVLALIAVGAGWSLASSAALIALHRAGPSRLAIAAHDACILVAGAGGVIASRLIFPLS